MGFAGPGAVADCRVAGMGEGGTRGPQARPLGRKVVAAFRQEQTFGRGGGE